MSEHNDGGPVFPLPFILDPTRGESGMYVDAADAGVPTGLSVRDYFAAKAVQGIFASDTHCDECGNFSDCSNEYYSEAARHAYAMADAMLKAREVQP